MEYVDLKDVQGNILRGYNLKFVRHLIVRVADPAAARRFLDLTISGSNDAPHLTTAEEWEPDEKPLACLNVGVTATGLRALGLNKEGLGTFPIEFREGAVARAAKVGDIGSSAPEHWADGLGHPDSAHLMWTIHGSTVAHRDRLADQIETLWAESRAFHVTSRLDGAALPDHPDDHVDKTKKFLGDKVHFGYRDSIAQPRFEINDKAFGRVDHQPTTPIGAVLLGYKETSFPDVSWRIPSPPELGRNGCYNAFRVMEQDVHEFEQFLGESAKRLGWNKELVAAKLMGRWRNGVALAHHHMEVHKNPDTGMPLLETDRDEQDLNDFDYPDMGQGAEDLEGRPCPIGAHIRRANPRGSRIVQRSANYTRPIVRRGMPYGSPYDPGNPADGVKRGLLGNFLCASLTAQFEAIMFDWINLGLHDPRITGTNCPIIGANNEATSRFEIRVDKDTTVVLEGFPRFTHTRGSIYLFCPSVTAVGYLAALSG